MGGIRSTTMTMMMIRCRFRFGLVRDGTLLDAVKEDWFVLSFCRPKCILFHPRSKELTVERWQASGSI